MNVCRSVFLAVVCAAFMSAADVDGRWTAQVPGRGGDPQTVTFNFKAVGETLTGTMATARGELEISEGKVAGDNISFAVKMSFQGNEMKMLYKGVVSGQEIRFTRTREGGQGRTQEFTARKTTT